jgi:DNA-binding NtrC family response regulator
MAELTALLNLLIIENLKTDQEWIKALARAFGVQEVDTATNIAEAEEKLRTGRFNCAIVDMDFDNNMWKGLEVLQNPEFDSVFKIVLTIFVDTFTIALLRGARRFIPKLELAKDADLLKLALYDAAISVQYRLAVYYQSDVMVRFMQKVAAVARKEDPVLIVGESGSGKEVIAHAIHKISNRAQGPFEPMNCACLDQTSAEADLFGVADKGYTGTAARPGIFERVNGGTVFFDEIGEMREQEQRRLLRILENPDELVRSGGYQRVHPHGKPVNFRCVFATDRDLMEAVQQGKFHRPLLERISTHILEVPPLNSRRDDIPVLARHYLRNHSEDINRLPPEALKVFTQADWTGRNVRGLWNAIARALILAEVREDVASAVVTPADAVEAIRISARPLSQSLRPMDAITDGSLSLNEVEAEYIKHVLSKCGNKISAAASILGIGRNTLYQKIRRYNLSNIIRQSDAESEPVSRVAHE